MSERPARLATDPLRQYLREIGALRLLTREQEVTLAKRVEEGERRIGNAIAASAAGLAELEELGARLRRRELDIRDLTRDVDADDGRRRRAFLRRLGRVARVARAGGAGRQRALATAVDALRLKASALRAVAERVKHRQGERDAGAAQRAACDAIGDGERLVDGARAELVRANLRLVVATARRYAQRGLPLLDLIQEGNLGLMQGIERFDHRRGFKISTYVIWWIRQAMARAVLEKARTIRVPYRIHRDLAEMTRATRRLAHALGREPTFDELAGALAQPADEVRELLRVPFEPMSLDAPAGVAGEATLADFVHDSASRSGLDEAMADSVAVETRQALATLTPREEKILRLRFGIGQAGPRTLKEIGSTIGLTRERIRQIEEKALGKLRRPGIRRRLAALIDE